jgi:2-polyprenyl-3-methyl-5-hydroxy-6-metoxy-1,4-benzoquinol methylase
MGEAQTAKSTEPPSEPPMAPASRRCRLCHGSAFRPLLRVEKANFTSGITSYDIIRCKTCGLAMMDPFPGEEAVKEIYVRESTFSQSSPNPYRRNPLFPLLEPIYRRYGDGRHFILRTCLRLAPKGRRLKVLDIGCGTGALIEAFQTMTGRADATGIDIDPRARERAKESVRDSIVVGDFLTHPLPGPFDIVTMEMLIEHLLDPSRYIERCARLLRPGGLLFLSTPDIDSPQAREQGADWWLVNRPGQKLGHVIWFNRTSIEHLAKKHGLRIAFYRNRGNLLPHMPGGLRRALEAALGQDPASGRFIRWYPIRILWALIVSGWISEGLSKGEYLYAFLVKEATE